VIAGCSIAPGILSQRSSHCPSSLSSVFPIRYWAFERRGARMFGYLASGSSSAETDCFAPAITRTVRS
jgi:hypothetical protein